MFSAGGGTFKLADFGHALHVGDTAAPAPLQGDLCAPSVVHRMETHRHDNTSAASQFSQLRVLVRARSPAHTLCL